MEQGKAGCGESAIARKVAEGKERMLTTVMEKICGEHRHVTPLELGLAKPALDEILVTMISKIFSYDISVCLLLRG